MTSVITDFDNVCFRGSDKTGALKFTANCLSGKPGNAQNGTLDLPTAIELHLKTQI